MQTNYWSSLLRQRLGRRRAIVAASGASAAAAFLAACGGGSPDSSDTSSSAISRPIETTDKAKPGGVLKHFAISDASHFDALASNASGVVNWVSTFAYPRMLKFVTPKFPKPADGTTEGELAETFELSPDKLTLTFKLRQGMKWDARAPTNGRVIDTQDILFSWNKYLSLNPSASNLSNAKSPAAPVESVTAPDGQTIVVKMKQPDVSTLQLFAERSHFYIMPRESDGGFDPRTVVRGHGPWILEEHVPASRFVWRRNPDYYVKGRPFPEKMERPIVPEYATQLAQFKVGNIYTSVANATDVLQTKRDVPETAIFQDDAFATSISNYTSFGYEGNSPFKDTRVRQAASMLIDRDAYLDVMDNRDNFKAEGIDVPARFHTIVGAGWDGYWVDPTDTKAFGPNAKYFVHDVAEAKKLLAAAGLANGFNVDMIYSTTQYGAAYQKSAERSAGMRGDGGIRLTLRGHPYEQFKDKYYEGYYASRYTKGEVSGHDGLIHLADAVRPTVAFNLFGFVHKDGTQFKGFTPDGKNAHLGDPKLNDLVEKIKVEFDRERSVALVKEVIQYFAEKSYYIVRPGTVKGLSIWWPAIGNLGVGMPSPGGENQWAERWLDWWIDSTKAPLKQA